MSLAPRIDKIEKNAWINGNFDFWQRIAGNTVTINTATPQNFYGADRVLTATGGPTVKNYSIVRSTDVPTVAQSGFTASYSYLFTAISAIASPTATDVVNNEYRIEGLDYARFHGKTAYLNFWVKNSVAGTYPISVYANTPVNQSLVTSYTVNSPNTWEFKSLPITFQSAGAYAFDVSWQISIRMIAGGIGSNFNAAALNTWQSGNFVTHPSITGNVMGAAGQTTRFSMISLTETAIAQGATYERAGRTYAGELQLCQRYYEKSYDLDTVPGTYDGLGVITATWGDGSGNHYHSQQYRVVKRSIPSCQTWSGNNPPSIGSWNVVSASFNGQATVNKNPQTGGCIYQGFSYNGNLAARAWFHWTADAEL